MEIASLGSGSKGNSMYVGINGVNILVDVGLSMKQIWIRLISEMGVDLEDVNLILITHAHSDHVKSLHTIVNKYPHIKVVITQETYDNYVEKSKKTIPKENRLIISQHKVMKGGSVNIAAYRVNHDAPAYAFKITDNDTGETYLHLADNGGIKKRDMFDKFKGMTYYALESNYDRNMELFHPTRPDLTKRRTIGYYGHTENGDAISLATQIITPSTRGIIFHHLSEECNTKEQAKATHEGLIRIFGNIKKFSKVKMVYAEQDEVTILKGGVWD